MIAAKSKRPSQATAIRSTGPEDKRKSHAGQSAIGKNGVQGEGNYKAARDFNQTERKFVASGKVASAARAAAPKSEAERKEMVAAEEEGKRRAKEENLAATDPWGDSAAARVLVKDTDRKRW